MVRKIPYFCYGMQNTNSSIMKNEYIIDFLISQYFRHTVMICHGESEFMKNYSTSMGLKSIQAFSSNVLMALLQCFIVFTTWDSFGKADKMNLVSNEY